MNRPFSDFAPAIGKQTALRRAITAACRRREPDCIPALIKTATLPDDIRTAARATTRSLITALRAKHRGTGVGGLVQEYALVSRGLPRFEDEYG